MKNILTFVFFLCSIALWAQNKSTVKSSGDFYLEYSSTSKTIIIKGTTLIVQEWIEQYDNPVSSMPSSRNEVKKTSVLSANDLSRLKSTIRANGFMNLPKNEYGSLGERYYPTTISVITGGKQKKILYKSNPSPETEQAPKAFSEVEKVVNEIVSGIKQWK